jgi:two-component system phosphate regulon sensor histidine kinase PhoR
MSIALVGVIIIQFLWIKNAIQIKQEQFDRSVHHALISVSADLENRYGVHLITEKLENDSNARNEVLKQDPGFYQFMISVDKNKQRDDESYDLEDDSKNTESSVISISNIDDNIYPSNSKAKGEVLSSSMQGAKVITTVNVKRNNSEQIIIQNSTLKKPKAVAAGQCTPNASGGCNLMKIVKSAADEYAMSKMSEKEINDIIDSPKISSAIKMEFARQGLPLDFVFGTYCVSGDTAMINKAYSNNPMKDFAYKSPLLATDFVKAGSLLLLDFPGHFRYLLASVAGMLLLSLFFTLAIVTAFAFSLHVIFRQKKLSDITNDFINNMTHELKTPLATISLTADTLGLSSVSTNSEMVGEYSGMIKNEVKKLSRHVDRILEAAVLERNGNKQQTEILSINQLAGDEVKIFEPIVQQRGGKIEAHLPEEEIKIHANRDMIRGVICNLLDNAVKYSKEKPDITISVSRSGSNLLCYVEDHGVGISKADQKMIFEKFYRAHTGNRHDVKGFGLGLSFVKNVIESMHGRVWVESEQGKGSRFYFEFPLL